MISFYGASPFLNSNASHLLAALCPGINTSCFPSCSTAKPRKLCCISEELLLLIWKRHLRLTCCVATSHAVTQKIAVWPLQFDCHPYTSHTELDCNSKIRDRISGAQHPHWDQTSQRTEVFKGLQSTDQLCALVLLRWPLYTKQAELCGKSGRIFGRTWAKKLNPPITHIWIPFP